MTDEQTSFLHEAQKFGKATDKVEIDNLDTILNDIAKIKNDEAISFFKTTDPAQWPTAETATYCHNCRNIVETKIVDRKIKGRFIKKHICLVCGGSKIVKGKKEVLQKFYHIDSKDFGDKVVK